MVATLYGAVILVDATTIVGDARLIVDDGTFGAACWLVASNFSAARSFFVVLMVGVAKMAIATIFSMIATLFEAVWIVNLLSIL